MAATRQRASQKAEPVAQPPVKRKPGRPATVVTPKVVQEIADELALGIPKRLVLLSRGIAEATWETALSRHPEFETVVAHARKEFVEDALKRVRLGDKGWQGPAWILERRYTEDFGVKIAPNVQVNVGIGIGEDQVAKIQAFARQKLGTSRSQKGKLAADWQQDGQVVDVQSSVSGSQPEALPAPAKPAKPAASGPEATTPAQVGAIEPDGGDEW